MVIAKTIFLDWDCLSILQIHAYYTLFSGEGIHVASLWHGNGNGSLILSKHLQTWQCFADEMVLVTLTVLVTRIHCRIPYFLLQTHLFLCKTKCFAPFPLITPVGVSGKNWFAGEWNRFLSAAFLLLRWFIICLSQISAIRKKGPHVSLSSNPFRLLHISGQANLLNCIFIGAMRNSARLLDMVDCLIPVLSPNWGL